MFHRLTQSNLSLKVNFQRILFVFVTQLIVQIVSFIK